MYISEMHFL